MFFPLLRALNQQKNVLHDFDLQKISLHFYQNIYDMRALFVKYFYTMKFLILKKVQKNKNKVYKTNFDTICIEYYYREKLYKILSKVPRGPSRRKITNILNNENDSVLEKIAPFMGPLENWHNIEYTCSDFGEKKLNFIFNDGTNVEKNELDSLQF